MTQHICGWCDLLYSGDECPSGCDEWATGETLREEVAIQIYVAAVLGVGNAGKDEGEIRRMWRHDLSENARAPWREDADRIIRLLSEAA